MSASTAANTANVDKKAVKQVCNIWKSLELAIEQKTRIIVEMLYNADDHTREAMVKGMIEDGIKPSWAMRMEACAIKGLIDAVHLYREFQIVCARSIKAAGLPHIRKMANPVYDFSWIDNEGRTVHIQAQKLNYHQALAVWSPSVGVISLADQRKARKVKFNPTKPTAAPVYKVHHAVSKTDPSGRKLMELHLCFEGEHIDREVRTMPVSELRKYVK